MSNEFLPPTLDTGKVSQVPPVVPNAVPNVPDSQKTFNWFWLMPVVLVVALATGFYFFYAQNVPPSEIEKEGPPAVAPYEGMNYPSTPASTPEATPALTGSDSLGDIEKDLVGTNVDAGAKDFTDLQTDLQGL